MWNLLVAISFSVGGSVYTQGYNAVELPDLSYCITHENSLVEYAKNEARKEMTDEIDVIVQIDSLCVDSSTGATVKVFDKKAKRI